MSPKIRQLPAQTVQVFDVEVVGNKALLPKKFPLRIELPRIVFTNNRDGTLTNNVQFEVIPKQTRYTPFLEVPRASLPVWAGLAAEHGMELRLHLFEQSSLADLGEEKNSLNHSQTRLRDFIRENRTGLITCANRQQQVALVAQALEVFGDSRALLITQHLKEVSQLTQIARDLGIQTSRLQIGTTGQLLQLINNCPLVFYASPKRVFLPTEETLFLDAAGGRHYALINEQYPLSRNESTWLSFYFGFSQFAACTKTSAGLAINLRWVPFQPTINSSSPRSLREVIANADPEWEAFVAQQAMSISESLVAPATSRPHYVQPQVLILAGELTQAQRLQALLPSYMLVPHPLEPRPGQMLQIQHRRLIATHGLIESNFLDTSLLQVIIRADRGKGNLPSSLLQNISELSSRPIDLIDFDDDRNGYLHSCANSRQQAYQASGFVEESADLYQSRVQSFLRTIKLVKR